jgi:glycosyltransferase involved in cell wall biosynthesis
MSVLIKGDKKILFLQPAYAHYRKVLFSTLARRYTIKFVFEKTQSVYPGLHFPEGIDYLNIDQFYKHIPLGITACLIRYSPDVVVTAISTSLRTLIAFSYCRLFKKKMVLWQLQWRDPDLEKHNVLKRLKYYMGSLFMIHADAVVVGGTAAKKFALSKNVDETKIFWGIQCANGLTKNEYHQIKRTTSGRLNLLYFGRIIRCKGLDTLIKAVSLLEKEDSDFNLKIVGDGPYRKECERLATALDVRNINFAGPVLPTQIKQELAQADVFILPSRIVGTSFEAWGLVINEALSAGLPIVTTYQNGASHDLVVHGRNGFICAPDDPLALYNTLVSCTKGEFIRMGKESRKIYDDKNSFSTMADGFSNAIDHVSCVK